MTGRAPDFSQAAWLPNATSGPCLKFFQQRDLARVIELMLGDSVEHEGDVVPLARDAFAEAVFGETARRAEQVRMRFSGLGNGLLPRRGALVGDGREILAPLQLHGLAKDDAAVDGIVQAAMWSTSSQMLWAPATGCAAAVFASTPARSSRTAGPCQAPPAKAFSSCWAMRAVSVMAWPPVDSRLCPVWGVHDFPRAGGDPGISRRDAGASFYSATMVIWTLSAA